MSSDENTQHAKEIAFHDRLARAQTFEDADSETFFTAPTAMDNHYILSRMGCLRGGGGSRRILDLGAGAGEGAVYFAAQGAETSFCDISPGMVEFVEKLAAAKNLRMTGKACPAEALDFPDDSFDYVYLHGVLHHISDRDKAYREIFRVLRPGGAFFAMEPLIGNPAMWIYRRMATKVRSDDEAPLTLGEVDAFSKYFARCGCRAFWLLTQSLFMKYYLFDRIHPNSDRYWRRIYKETDKSLWWWKPLRAVDSILTKVPLLNRMSYCAVFYGEKP